MTMQMRRAFNFRMMAPMTLYSLSTGSYDADNNWVEGASTPSTIRGVITAGNKFSQFDEGISLHSEDGGARYSNYRNLYIPVSLSNNIKAQDKIEFRGAYYNVLQESDEVVFGFTSWILEKSEDETP